MLAGRFRDLGDAALQDAVDSAFISGTDGFRYDARGYQYEVDFGNMKQVNLSTMRERDIKRILMNDIDAFVPIASATPAAMVPVPSAPSALSVKDLAPKRAARARATPPAPLVPMPMPAPVVCEAKKAPSLPCGKVKDFFNEKGFGFVRMKDSTDDVFFHVSAIQGPSVKKNDTVECALSRDRSGRTRATKVILRKKAPLMRLICRNPTCQSKKDSHFEDRCPIGGYESDENADAD